jgi:hypothetical protein
MHSLTRINLDSHHDSSLPLPDSLSKYNLRPRKVSNSDVAGSRTGVPTLSTRRKRSDTRSDWENVVDGAPALKKIRRDAPTDNPVFKTSTGATETQQSATVRP